MGDHLDFDKIVQEFRGAFVSILLETLSNTYQQKNNIKFL